MKNNENEFEINLGNYYGTVTFAKRQGEYVIELDDWDDTQGLAISEEFYEAAKKEFLK